MSDFKKGDEIIFKHKYPPSEDSLDDDYPIALGWACEQKGFIESKTQISDIDGKLIDIRLVQIIKITTPTQPNC